MRQETHPVPETATLRPAQPELVVRDPETLQRLAADGETKLLSTFWQRRIAEGDVVVLPQAIDAPAAE